MRFAGRRIGRRPDHHPPGRLAARLPRPHRPASSRSIPAGPAIDMGHDLRVRRRCPSAQMDTQDAHLRRLMRSCAVSLSICARPTLPGRSFTPSPMPSSGPDRRPSQKTRKAWPRRLFRDPSHPLWRSWRRHANGLCRCLPRLPSTRSHVGYVRTSDGPIGGGPRRAVAARQRRHMEDLSPTKVDSHPL